MVNAKIEIKIGALTFSGEGDEAWLTKQLDKLLENAPKLSKLQVDLSPGDAEGKGIKLPSVPVGTLASFLNAKNTGANQNMRFLATAIWLHSKGKAHISTGEVTKALVDNHQKRLGNPAECLNQNVGKGYCEKVGKEFYVTEEGKAALK